MPGLVDVAWFIYSNSGPAINLVFIALVVLGWKYEVHPRLTDLEDVQGDHDDELEDKRLDNAERDILLDEAHSRIDQADQARKSLRQRLTRLEQAFAREADGNPDDYGIGPGMEQRADGGQPQTGEPRTDGGSCVQDQSDSDDDNLDLTLNIDVEGDGYIHVETAPQQDTDDPWMQDVADQATDRGGP